MPPLPPIEATPLQINTITNNQHNQHQQHRIITSASSLRGSNNSTTSSLLNNDAGDIIVSIVNDNNDDTGLNNNCNSNCNDDNLTRRVVVQRMGGKIIASFELPTSTTSPQTLLDAPSNDNDEWSTYLDPIICWASFRNKDDTNNTSSSSGEGGRKMLCILGNPTTLYVYDVLDDAGLLATTTTTTTTNSSQSNYNNNNNDNNSAEHVIPLPFRAKSIYENGTNEGLLIVRMASDEDYVLVDNNQGYEMAEVANGDGVEGGGQPTPMGLSLPATPRGLVVPAQQKQQQQQKKAEDDKEEEMSLEDPPEPLRDTDEELFDQEEFNNINNNNNQVGVGDMYNNPGDASVMYNQIGESAFGGVPCLFSLHHPLDEIRPLAMSISTPNLGDNNNIKLFANVNETLVYVGSPRLFHGTLNNQGGTRTTSSPICVTYNETLNRHTIWSLNKATKTMETLPLWKTTGRGTWREDEEGEVMKNTDTEATSDGQEDEPNIVDGQQQQQHKPDEEESSQNDMSQDTENTRDNIQPLKGLLMEEDEDVSMELQRHDYPNSSGVPSSFSDIHPDFTMVKLFVEEINESALPNASGSASVVADMDVETTTKASNEVAASGGSDGKDKKKYQRQIFLTTDVHGKGDLVLCMFIPNTPEEKDKEESSTTEPALLRCYSLHLPDGAKNDDIQTVSHLVDLPCSSVQPIQAVPIPLAPFSLNDSTKEGSDKNRRSTSRYQTVDMDTMATDVLVLRQEEQQNVTSLYRSGAIHVADFALPESTLDNFCPSSSAVKLSNGVGNRVDIHFMKSDSGITSTTIVRTSFSLVMHTSPIAEKALRAIESSLVASCDSNIWTPSTSQQQPHISDTIVMSQQFPTSWLGTILPFLIRADCVRLFQQVSSEESGMEDIGWYSLTVVLLNLLGLKSDKNSKHANDKSTTSEEESSDAWEMLLQSDFHSEFVEGEGRILFGDISDDLLVDSATKRDHSISDEKQIGLISSLLYTVSLQSDVSEVQAYTNLIFDSLHLLHEDSRLCQSRGRPWTRRLGTLLLHVVEQMSPLMMDYEDHYHRQLGTSRCLSNACDSYSIQPGENKKRLSTFSLAPCIMTTLDNIPQHDQSKEAIGIEGYTELLKHGLNGVCSTTWIVLRLFCIIFDKTVDNSSQSQRDRLAVLAMLDEGIYHSSQLLEELPVGVILPLLEAIRRCRLDPPQVDPAGGDDDCWPPAAFDLVGRNDIAEFLSQSKQGLSIGGGKVVSDDVSPTSEDPDKDGLVGLEEYSAMIFPDDNRVKEAARLLRSSRPLFLRVPRPPELSDHDYERTKQEKLLLLCRRSISLPLGRGMLTLGTHNVSSAAEQLIIPNIVLAGRVFQSNGMLALDMSSTETNFKVWPEFHNGAAAGLRLPHASADKERIITRTWIKFNKPATPVEPNTGSNNNPTPPPSYAHGGFLMALGLRGYLSALTTTDLTDYLTQGIITTTTGIFLGMAANKRGTCDPSVSKMLCLHIPTLLPPSFIPMDIASTVQAAAVAGIGLLYQGSSHRLMTEFLLNEIGRQPMKDQNSNDREGYSLVCGLALGCVNLAKGSSSVSGLEDLKIEERLQRYITGVSTSEFQRGQKEDHTNGLPEEKNSRIFEVDSLNTDITAPGSTLALGLMYIKSHNISIASSLQLPDTHFSLDYIRPDLLALRVISRSLILWDNVEPSAEWIDLQIPSIVKSCINMMKNAAKRSMNTADADSISSEDEKVTGFDPSAVRQANAYIISGACFALGLKYAGTANREAASAIIQRVLWFLELRDNKDVFTLTQRPDQSTLITCLCTASISLAMVMAGTGDLDSFRLFRSLRWKCDDATLYGTHLAFNSAIGLLFVGGGKCTLRNKPEDVAMLITSFYPHFPILSSDNQYHLQALRHLYVLAVQERILEACDIDSKEKVCIPIELSVEGSNELVKASTPFLVANDAKFVELCSKSDRYYQVRVHATDWSSGNISTLFVKRKAGTLSYIQDPNGLRSLSMQTGTNSRESFMKSIKQFSADAMIKSCAEYFCFSSFDDDKLFERFCGDVVLECMREEKSDILPIYLKLFRLIESSPKQQMSVEQVWDIRLLKSYTETRNGLDGSSLLTDETFTLLCERVDDSFEGSMASLIEIGSDRKWWGVKKNLGTLLVWIGIPINQAKA